MFVQQLYTNCLSEAAYFIASEGEAVVIDPLRDIDDILKLAEEKNVKIKYIFETHFHADFISGHLELANAVNAPIIFGPGAKTSYKIHNAKDGEKFTIGKLEIEVLHTPGHTMESCCYLLKNEKNIPYAVFTGDTLFVGDVGRPDLFGAEITKEDLAGHMFDSLNAKLKVLPDDVIVYPAHGPGSSCGKNLGEETWSTIGKQKQTNPALQKETKEEFIKAVTADLVAPPKYFSRDARINQEGYVSLEEILNNSYKPLSVNDFEEFVKNGTIILDSRKTSDFELGFINGAIGIGLEDRFAEWVGNIVDLDSSIVIVTEKGKEKETIIRLARVGFENVKGYLHEGVESWSKANKPMDMVISVSPYEFGLDLKLEKKISVLDVRKHAEFENGHLINAVNIPLQQLPDVLDAVDKKTFDLHEHIYIHCQTGYRSMIASSLFKRKGYTNVKNISSGYEAMENSDLPVYSSFIVGNQN